MGIKNAAELARLLGVSDATISEYFGKKKKQPRTPTLQKMAEVLETTTDYLLGGVEDTGKPATTGAKHTLIGRVRPVPFYGRISAGTGLVAHEEIETLLMLPEEIMDSSKEYFMLTVEGESMSVDGLRSGDWVLIERTDNYEPGKVQAILLAGNDAVLGRLEYVGEQAAVRKSNPEFPSLPVEPGEFRILGTVRKRFSDV